MTTNQIDFKVKNGLVVVTTATIQSTLSSNSTNTGALQVVGGIGIGGGGYFGGVVTATNFILNGYQVSTGTTAASGTGTTTTFVISNLTPTSSTATGALQVYGGVGIGGGLFVGGTITATNITVNGYAVSTGTTAASGTGTTTTFVISNLTQSTGTNSGALQVYGGVGVGGNLYAGTVNAGATSGEYLQLSGANLPASASNIPSIFSLGSSTTYMVLGVNGAGYIAFSGSGSNSAEVFRINAANASGSTNRLEVTASASGSGPILSAAGGTSSSDANIDINITPKGTGRVVVTGTATSISTTTGALVVTGGAGIGQDLYVGGTVTATNFLLNGYQVSTSTTVNVGSVVVQSTTSSAVFYPVFVSTSTTSTTALSEYTTNSFSIIPSTGAVNIASTTSATSTTTGALTVTGGVGIGGSLYAGNIYSNGAQILPSIITEFTATAGQTLFTIPAGYSVGTVQVFANGIQLGSADYTASNGSTITLNTARNSGDIIRVVAGISATVITQDPIVVNDISNQFNNISNVFALMQDQTPINSIMDSKDLEVVIDGQRLAPYVDEYRYPWITPYDSYKGFRVRGAYLTIYNAPAVGSSAVVVVQATSKARQKRKYPYSASSIAFGD